MIKNLSSDDLLKLLDQLHTSRLGQKMEEWWAKLSPADQIKMYQDGAPTLLKTATRSSPVLLTGVNMLRFDNKTAAGLAAFIAPGVRTMLQMGLLKLPKGLPHNQVHADTAQDAKSLTTTLEAAIWLVTAIAPEAIQEAEQIKALFERVMKMKTELALSQQKKLHPDLEGAAVEEVKKAA